MREAKRQPSSEDIKAFRDKFLSRDSITLGTPTPTLQLTPSGKIEWSYVTTHRPYTDGDIFRHMVGTVSLVTSPHLQNNTCHWFAVDNDVLKFRDFTPPEWSRSIFNWYESKSGFIHGFGFLPHAWPVEVIVRLLEEWTRKLGWSWPIETFPDHRQIANPPVHCSAINLPFFGMRTVPAVRKSVIPIEEWWKDTSGSGATRTRGKDAGTESTNDEPGYWFDEALEAMLTAYKAFIPGFEFCKCGNYYEVPCPGNRNLGGWPDGNLHSDDNESLLSDKTVVFIKNCWPKFKCMHAHCDGAFGEKKTINDWRGFFDPLRFWEFADWQDAEMVRLERMTHVR